MKFKFLTGDVNYQDYGGKWISNKQKSIDFPFYYVMELINMHEATGDKNQEKYAVEMSVYSPEASGDEMLKNAAKCIGMMEEEMITDEMKVAALSDYGCGSPCFSLSGNNYKELLSEARKEVDELDVEANLSEPKNGLGATGRDVLRGNLFGNAFKYAEMKVENGQLVETKSVQVNQGSLNSECWMIQINGLEACKNCQYLNKRNCGGKQTRKQMLQKV
jgi:hypothetical protein